MASKEESEGRYQVTSDEIEAIRDPWVASMEILGGESSLRP
jgi:hypothetical protein